jgi:DNA invertase Pin-like site-specific DNA recombinase
MGAVGANLGHTETLSQFPTHFSYDHNAISGHAATTWFAYGLTSADGSLLNIGNQMIQQSRLQTPLRAALYARVSTDRQSTENQLIELRQTAERLGWEVVGEFVDAGISGAKGRKDRPQLDAMLKGVARKDFDVVASWSVDRLGRSLIDLVSMLQELHSTGVDLYLHQQGINTTTPAGRALFGMMGVFAEFERGMIQERVRAGMARAKAKGTKSGNAIGRPVVSSDIEGRIRALRTQGLGMIKIANQAGCGVSVVQRVLACSPL